MDKAAVMAYVFLSVGFYPEYGRIEDEVLK
jgi:hypothetical protein